MVNIYDIWLSEKAGNRIREALSHFGRENIGFSEASLSCCHEKMGIGEQIYKSSLFPEWKRDVENYFDIIRNLKEERIQVVSLFHREYPYLLSKIFDPPFLLYYKGKLPKREERTAAVIGARKVTDYGRYLAFTISKLLAEGGVNVVSGLALGADTAAHRGAVQGKGRTTAVLGSGVDQYTPLSNRGLGEHILRMNGCILSEFIPGTPGLPRHYPRRNRIISGMSECVIVVEAGLKSGTSITAGLALEQGRDVYAVPGNITNPYSVGTNLLIKDGATPLLSIEDILTEMGISSPQQKIEKNLEIYSIEDSKSKKEKFHSEKRKTKHYEKGCSVKLGKDEVKVYKIIQSYGEIPFDDLCIKSNESASQVAGILTVLEIKGMILRLRNKIMIAK